MRALLLDARGVVLAAQGDAPTGAGLVTPGTHLPTWLMAQGAQAPAPALHALLDAALGSWAAPGSPALPEPAADGGHWVVTRLPPGTEAALLLQFRPDAEHPVSELRRTRTDLALAERRLAAVQAVAGIGSWSVDLATGRVQYADETYRVLGMDPARGPMRSAAIRSRIHPDDLPQVLARRDAMYAGEPGTMLHARWRRDDGNECWIEVRVSRDDAGIVGTVRDVSASMQTQHALERHRDRLEELVVSRTVQLAEASERAEAASRAKSAFLAHTSHEIRTPLNVILSLAHLMQRAGSDAPQRARVLAVEQAARHLSSIIDDVLDLARDEGQRPPLQAVPLQPAAVLAEVAAIVRPQAESRGLRLIVDAPPPQAPLHGDTARLRQALLNAAHHALGVSCGDELRLRARLGPASAGRTMLHFEVNTRAAAGSTAFDGDADLTALRRLARVLGGLTGVERADDGAGPCTVWFSAELASGGTDAAPAATRDDVMAQIRQRHAGRRVLLAEDDDVSQMAMVELLADVGLLVDTADDGRDAVDMASRRGYALILLDLRMPRMDGVSAARTIRTLGGHQHTPIVAVTANAFAEDRQACREAGVNEFLPKPVDVQRLYERVLLWLDSGSVVTGPGAAAAPRSVARPETQPMGVARPLPGDAGSRNATEPGLDALRAGMATGPGDGLAPAPREPRGHAAGFEGSGGAGDGSSVGQAGVAPAEFAPPAAPAPMSASAAPVDPAIAELYGLEGIDAEGGLASVGGKAAVYRRLLTVFADTHRDDAAELSRLVTAGDHGAASRQTHRLRGSAATLGLVDIEVAASALEGACDDAADPGIAATLPLLVQALAEALDGSLMRLREALAR